MNLILKGLTKNGKAALYTGAAAQVRINVTAFPDKVPAEVIEVADGALQPAKVKTPKVKLTKEERAALPKPTLAERIANEEKRLARLKAKAGL